MYVFMYVYVIHKYLWVFVSICSYLCKYVGMRERVCVCVYVIKPLMSNQYAFAIDFGALDWKFI